MSNQWPPAGSGQHPNDHGSPAGGYGGQPQQLGPQGLGAGSDPRGGQPGQPGAGQFGQFGQQGQYGQPGQYGPPGPQGQPGQFGHPAPQGGFGQPGQAGQYGQPGQYHPQGGQYGQAPHGAPGQGAPGGYGSGPQGFGGPGPQGGRPAGAKQGVQPWVWIVAGVAALALVGGAIWGGMALLGGGGGAYGVASSTGVAGVVLGKVEGDYTDLGFSDDTMVTLVKGDFLNGDGCTLSGYYSAGDSDVGTLDNPERFRESLEGSGAPSGDYEDLGTRTLLDTNGVPVEFRFHVFRPGDGSSAGSYGLVHVFADSNSALFFMGGCMHEDVGADGFVESLSAIPFTVEPEQ